MLALWIIHGAGQESIRLCGSRLPLWLFRSARGLWGFGGLRSLAAFRRTLLPPRSFAERVDRAAADVERQLPHGIALLRPVFRQGGQLLAGLLGEFPGLARILDRRRGRNQ